MIGSIVLFVVLFAAASLGWGFVFQSDRPALSHRLLLLVFFFIVAMGILSSAFFLRALSDEWNSIALTTSSLVFALLFVFSLITGFAISSSAKMSTLFSRFRAIWRGETKEKDRSDIVDEIIAKITETAKIDAFEKRMIESILKFSDKIVREVMVPRGDIVAINIAEEPRRVVRKVAEEGYSRMPVYSGSIDNIVGIIYAKDLLTMSEGSGAIVLQDLLRAPYYVPESKKISQLLREMQRNKVHLAVVVDEFGGTEGIVTLEDVLEEIVGEIQDEYDESLSELTRDDDGDIHISGSLTVERFTELLGREIPREDDYDTMAGFVQKLAGKLPQKGEVYNYDEMYFVIEEVAKHRIKRLKVSFKEHPRQVEDVESTGSERMMTEVSAAADEMHAADDGQIESTVSRGIAQAKRRRRKKSGTGGGARPARKRPRGREKKR